MGCGGAQEEKPVELIKGAGADGTCFFIVEHQVDPEKAEAFWTTMGEMMADQEKFGAAVAKHKEAGFFNHAFMPESQTHMFCIWEGQAGKSQADMEAFINTNEASPATTEAGFTNTVWTVRQDLSGPAAWSSQFAEGAAAPAPTTNAGGSGVFLIRHDFKEGVDPAEWWKGAQELMADEAKFKASVEDAKAKGFFNNAFMATAEAGPCFCIWEGQKGKTKDDMAAFIDKDAGSPAGETFMSNTVVPLNAELNPMPPLSTTLSSADDRSCVPAMSC